MGAACFHHEKCGRTFRAGVIQERVVKNEKGWQLVKVHIYNMENLELSAYLTYSDLQEVM